MPAKAGIHRNGTLPWQSKFAAKYTKPLVRQLIGILSRDIQAALDDVAGGAGILPAFQEWDLATVPTKNFPACVVVPHSVEFSPESQQALQESIRLSIAVAVTHQDPSACAEIVQDYVRAVDEVLNSAWWLTEGDFYSTTLALPSPPYAPVSTTPGLQGASLKRLFVAGHEYDELRRLRAGMFATAATLVVVAELEES